MITHGLLCGKDMHNAERVFERFRLAFCLQAAPTSAAKVSERLKSTGPTAVETSGWSLPSRLHPVYGELVVKPLREAD
jgi:hypothetical protein